MPQTENDSSTFGSPKPGNLASFELDAVAGLGAGISEGRECQAARIEFAALTGQNPAVFEKTNVCDVDLVIGDRESVRVTPDRCGAHNLLQRRVDNCNAEVGYVRTVKMLAVTADLHVHGIAVLKLAAANLGVQRNRHGVLWRLGINDINGSRFATAPIQRSPVGRKVGAARIRARVCRFPIFWRSAGSLL